MQGDYYKTKDSVNEYIKLAKEVSGKDLIEKLEQVLSLNSAVLEIGSGPGTDWKILDKTYNVIGSDNSTEFLEHLRTENPNGEFLELDATTLQLDKEVDGIYSNKVLHHLNDDDLAKSIQRQFDILNTGGIVCHSFWSGEGSEVFKGLFVNYHDKKSLLEKFENYFEIISIEAYKEFEDNDSLLLIGKRK